MAESTKPAPAHWIDHFVVGTNDLNAWVDWAEVPLELTIAALEFDHQSPTGE